MRSRSLLAASLVVMALLAACADQREARVRFANEGDRCRNANLLYINQGTGDELRCEGYLYSGPLSDNEADEVLALANRLGDDGELSDTDKDRVRDLAANPPATDIVRFDAIHVTTGSDAVWVTSEYKSYQRVMRVDARTGETSSFDVSLTPHVGGIAVTADAVWVANEGRDELVIARVDRGTQQERLVDLGVDRAGYREGYNPIAAAGDGVWVLGATTVSRLDPSTGEIADEIGLPLDPSNDEVPFAIDASDDAAWIAARGVPGALFRIDQQSGAVQRIEQERAPLALAVDNGVVWVLSEDFELEPPLVLQRLDAMTSQPTAEVDARFYAGSFLQLPQAVIAGEGAVSLLAPSVTNTENAALGRVDSTTGALIGGLEIEFETEVVGLTLLASVATAAGVIWVVVDGHVGRIDTASGSSTDVPLRDRVDIEDA